MNPSPKAPARRAAALLPPAISTIGPPWRPARRRNADLAAPVFDGLAAHQRAQHGQDLVGHPAAGGHVDAEVLVLLTPMADTERV